MVIPHTGAGGVHDVDDELSDKELSSFLPFFLSFFCFLPYVFAAPFGTVAALAASPRTYNALAESS